MKKLIQSRKSVVLGVIALAILSAGIPLLTACNPATLFAPACETNNTATTSFQNKSTTSSTYNVVLDGSTIVSYLAAGATSASSTVAAGSHTIQFKLLNGNAACSPAYPSLAQCSSYSYSCAI